jgi:hypothetical protein
VDPTAPSTTSTLIGPNGTAPGMNFVEQQSKPLNDSSDGRSAGLPLAIAALVLLVVFTTVFLKGRRARKARP